MDRSFTFTSSFFLLAACFSNEAADHTAEPAECQPLPPVHHNHSSFYASTCAEVGVDSLTINTDGFTQTFFTGRSYYLATGPKFLLEQTLGMRDIAFLRIKGSATFGMSEAMPALTVGNEGSTSYHTVTRGYRGEVLLGGDFSVAQCLLSLQPYIGWGIYHYKSSLRGFGTPPSPDILATRLRFYSPKVGIDAKLTPTDKVYLQLGLGLEFPHAFLDTVDLQDSIFDRTRNTKLTYCRHGVSAALRAGYKVSEVITLTSRVEFYSIHAGGPYTGLGDDGAYERAIGRVQSTSFSMGASFNY